MSRHGRASRHKRRGLSRPSTTLALNGVQDVDGRHKAGHDEDGQFEPALALIEARSASGSEPARAMLVRGLRLVKVQ